ncbi:oxygen-independent coproporphyrinogen III oxidase [Devosia psychrophila]|uniref:Coproporphyrinogen-III oxidase n=1 Tax=Devosia psychrophila TaxID=728005 RepID=A0A0F5PSF1_9HYPH|nr:oxygen-independent coproporphyrinogen III oxidase [Devosia psychrophila]KKC31331.1 coproporphyrinogen III oxidase [Devosia psychrophila]SFC89865.1 oxygen-independent coproporphyrinogen-3 oxidase [Devosia psychrophila]
MHDDLIERYAAPVPRYTSYPTAPHFHAGVTSQTYARWLGEVTQSVAISLYIHVPYCDRLCWFCGCHTKHTLRYEPITSYLDALYAEIDWVSERLAGNGMVSAIHLGGGSPTMLTPDDMARLKAHLAARFQIASDVEISIEIDPNDLGEDRFDAMASFGLTRASVGVQDFDPRVQRAINRIQSFEQTKHVIDQVRARGVHSVNVDVLYGLPYQTLESIEATIGQVLSLTPDRTALFGYAHVPWLKKHQQMIPDAALPNIPARFAQSMLAAQLLNGGGLQSIGFDHFARSTDSLAIAAAKGRLRRNFQGYTDDGADLLIGLGASAIGQLPQGYVQNITVTGDYQKAAFSGTGTTSRGFALTTADRLHGYAIEALLCRFSLRRDELQQFGAAGRSLFERARAITAQDDDGMTTADAECFAITDRGRPFVRAIAAKFDTYLGEGPARHSLAV